MAAKKKAKEISEEVIETEVVETEVEITESEEKKNFRQFIESYKEQNPKKYEVKKEELLNKLNTLK